MQNQAVRCKRGAITEQAFLQEMVQATIDELHALGWEDRHIVYLRQQGNEAFGKAFPKIWQTLHEDALYHWKRREQVLHASGLKPATLPPQPGVIAGYTWYQLRPIWDAAEKEMIARAERESRAKLEQAFLDEMRSTPPRRIGAASLSDILSTSTRPSDVNTSVVGRDGASSHT